MPLSDDEGRQAAEAFLADIAADDADASQMWAEFYGSHHKDLLAIGPHLLTGLNDALRRFTAGDRSVVTTRLVVCSYAALTAIKAREAEAIVAKAERKAERRAATSAAIGPAPDIAERMTGLGRHGIPLPDDVVSDGDFLATRVAPPEQLMAFYIEHLRANGWTLDLDNSRPRSSDWLPPQCYFSRPELTGRYVSILAGPGVDDPDLTRLSISEHDD